MAAFGVTWYIDFRDNRNGAFSGVGDNFLDLFLSVEAFLRL